MTKRFFRISILLMSMILCLGISISGDAKIDKDTILGIWLFDEVYIGNVALEPEDVKTAAEKGLEETLKIARSVALQGKLAVQWSEIKRGSNGTSKIY